MLQRTFIEVCSAYSRDNDLLDSLWQQVFNAYSASGRHYHGILHLEAMLLQLERVRKEIADWDIVVWSLFYHDIVYSALKTDNEERSAAIAEENLQALRVPAGKIEKVRQMILATKDHFEARDHDTNCFIDADLSILGADTLEYERYRNAVRKENRLIPDFIYIPGRRKVIQKFLDQAQIYKTAGFQHLERQARSNLQAELSDLQK